MSLLYHVTTVLELDSLLDSRPLLTGTLPSAILTLHTTQRTVLPLLLHLIDTPYSPLQLFYSTDLSNFDCTDLICS